MLVIGLDWEHIGGAQNLPVIAQPVPTDLAAGLPAGKFAGTVGEHIRGARNCRQAQMQFHGFGGWFASRQTRGTVGEHIGGAQNLPVIAQPVPTDLAAGLPAGKFAGTVGEMESRLH